jgi:hypothetical protein
LGSSGFFRRPDQADPGIVDQDTSRAVLVRDHFGKLGNKGLVSEISRQARGRSTFRLDRGHGLIDRLDVSQHHVVPGPGQHPGGDEAQALRGSGDDSDFHMHQLLQFHGGAVISTISLANRDKGPERGR